MFSIMDVKEDGCGVSVPLIGHIGLYISTVYRMVFV